MRTVPRLLRYSILLPIAVGMLHLIATGLAVRDPIDDLGWYLLHPLFLPLRGDVETDAQGIWNTAQLWLQLAAMLAMVLWIRRPRLTGAFLFYLLLGTYTFGTQLTGGIRWALLLAAGLLVLANRRAAAVFLLTLVLAVTTLMPTLGITIYGFVVGDLQWCVVPAVVVGILVSVLAVRWIPDGFMLVPAVVLVMLHGLNIAYGPSIHRHHDLPAEAGACDDLDVNVLNDLHGWEDNQAWTVQQAVDGLYVGGKNRFWKLSDTGTLLATTPMDKGRIFAIRMEGSRVLGVARDAVLEWSRGEEPGVVYERLMFPELQHFEIHEGEMFATPHKFPLLVRAGAPGMRYYGRPSGIWMFGVTRSDGHLFIWDGITMGRLDSETLEVEQVRDYATFDRSIAVYGGQRYLYRGRLISRTVDVVDPRSMDVVRSVSIEPPPRFFNVSDDESLLAAADFMHETVTLYSLADGVLLGRFRVGPRPRGLTWSSRKGAFLGVSACGVYEIKPDG